MSLPSSSPRAQWAKGKASRTRLAIAAAVIVLLWGACQFVGKEHFPDFSDYTDTDEKKEAFFTYLGSHVQEVNAEILNNRERLEEIRADLEPGEEPGWFGRGWIHEQLEAYEFDPVEEISGETLRQLSQRMDIIPPSLVLAQAAIESAWGTSRFARQGNNLFGMRTYTPGTGIVPKRRPAGATWEVAAYDTVNEGLAAYVHTLNTHDPYLQLRRIRAGMRSRGQPVTGSALTAGLRSYSELGYEYVAKVRSMIRSNNLEKYDK